MGVSNLFLLLLFGSLTLDIPMLSNELLQFKLSKMRRKYGKHICVKNV